MQLITLQFILTKHPLLGKPVIFYFIFIFGNI